MNLEYLRRLEWLGAIRERRSAAAAHTKVAKDTKAANKSMEANDGREEPPDDLVGLALSGGGLRSAAFNLGLIQALHQRGLLRFVDYLSCVSGGSYAGGMLSETIAREQRYDDEHFELAEEADGKQPNRVLNISKRGNYLFRLDLLANRFAIGLLLNLIPRISLVLAVGAGMALLWRCLDLFTVRDHLYGLGIRGDFWPTMLPPMAMFFFWLAWFAIALMTDSRPMKKASNPIFWIGILCLAISTTVLLGNGDISLSKPLMDMSAENRVTWQEHLRWPLFLAVAVGLIPMLLPRQLVRSGTAPRNSIDSWVFFYTSFALFLGIPLLAVGWFARENVSGFATYRGPDLVLGDVKDQGAFCNLLTDEGKPTYVRVAVSGDTKGDHVDFKLNRDWLQANDELQDHVGNLRRTTNERIANEIRLRLEEKYPPTEAPREPAKAVGDEPWPNWRYLSFVLRSRNFLWSATGHPHNAYAQLVKSSKDQADIESALLESFSWQLRNSSVPLFKIDTPQGAENAGASAGKPQEGQLKAGASEDALKAGTSESKSKDGAEGELEAEASEAESKLGKPEGALIAGASETESQAGGSMGESSDGKAEGQSKTGTSHNEPQAGTSDGESKAGEPEGKPMAGGPEDDRWVVAPTSVPPAILELVRQVRVDGELADERQRGELNRWLLEAGFPEIFRPRHELRRVSLIHHDQTHRMIWFVGSLIVFLVSSLLINPNTTSLHDYYRDRLAVAFLKSGESHGNDTYPDIRHTPLSECRPDKYGAPYPLIMGAASDGLPWWSHPDQLEPPFKSFLLSPLYTGASLSPDTVTGEGDFGISETQKVPGEVLSIGDAMAISGAALSPNYYVHHIVTAVMATLNLRMGKWIVRPHCWPTRRHRVPFLALIADDIRAWLGRKRKYVLVTDGGHVENLGLEALLERKCRLIIVSDAGQDPIHGFDDLARLWQRFRVQTGVELLEIGSAHQPLRLWNQLPYRPQAAKPNKDEVDAWASLREILESNQSKSRRHFFCALLRYPARDEKAKPTYGLLVYAKPCLTGDEDLGVINFALRNSRFPQEPTSDQAFSYAQFEAYRCLGHHTGEDLLAARGKRDLWTTRLLKEDGGLDLDVLTQLFAQQDVADLGPAGRRRAGHWYDAPMEEEFEKLRKEGSTPAQAARCALQRIVAEKRVRSEVSDAIANVLRKPPEQTSPGVIMTEVRGAVLRQLREPEATDASEPVAGDWYERTWAEVLKDLPQDAEKLTSSVLKAITRQRIVRNRVREVIESDWTSPRVGTAPSLPADIRRVIREWLQYPQSH